MENQTACLRETDRPVLLSGDTPLQSVRPLQVIEVENENGQRLMVTDSRGRAYIDRTIEGRASFVVSGALGWQHARLWDAEGRCVKVYRFGVSCATDIEDGDAGFGAMLRGLYFTMLAAAGGDGLGSVWVGDKLYRYFIRWLRDHTHTLKGMKYFTGDLRTGLELYADTQRADGMVYDRIAPRATVQGWRDYTFRKGDFIKMLNADAALSYTMQRIPVENDVEFLFIECLYRTWQATGDTHWMSRYLDHAKKAVAYTTSDRYRWSNTFNCSSGGTQLTPGISCIVTTSP